MGKMSNKKKIKKMKKIQINHTKMKVKKMKKYKVMVKKFHYKKNKNNFIFSNQNCGKNKKL